MPEPLPAEEVAARLAETLALCGWEGVDVEAVSTHVGGEGLQRMVTPGLRFVARPVQPVRSPYGAASSLTGARQRVRDRTTVLSAVLAQQAREVKTGDSRRPQRGDFVPDLDDIPGEAEEDLGTFGHGEPVVNPEDER